MTPQQTQFLTEYEQLCLKFKMHIASNMYHEMVLFDYNDEDPILSRSATEDIHLHVEEVRNTPLEG